MGYLPDLHSAAFRHLEAANELAKTRRRDVAGYLYGLAAECGVKAMMQEASLRPLPLQERRNDPFYAHFPELRSMLRDSLSGRRYATLLQFVSNDAFMSQWSTSMRYSNGKQILDAWIDAWASQARQVISSMGT
jgi:hypothetical protein